MGSLLQGLGWDAPGAGGNAPFSSRCDPTRWPGSRCARARSKLTLGLFYLGTNLLDFPAWPCQRPKGSFHQPGAAGNPRGTAAITSLPKYPRCGQKPRAPAGCLSLPGAPTAPGRVPGARAAVHTLGAGSAGRRPRGCVWCLQSHPAPLPNQRSGTGYIQPPGASHRDSRNEFSVAKKGKFSFVFPAAVSAFPCGGGCPHACERCADSLTH